MGLGDALMDTAAARLAQAADPRRVRVMYADKVPWSEVWENNPRLARPDEDGDFQLLYRRWENKRRPYHLRVTPKRYVFDLTFRPEAGELYLTDEERAFGDRQAGRVVVVPHIKPAASTNKRWPWRSWQQLAQLSRAETRLTQLGHLGAPQLDDVEFVATPTFRLACAVIARARAVIFHEGGCHHAAAALGVPGVVIFGGFTPVELTGYPLHCNLGVSLGNACGLRVPCEHCALEMARISPHRVFDALKTILRAR